jgi:hypothetical protein
MLRRDGDGSLYDMDQHRSVTLAELADDVRAGRRFRVTQHDSGMDRTSSVLLEVLSASSPAGAGINRLTSSTQLPALTGAVGAFAARAVHEHRDREEREPRRPRASRNAGGRELAMGLLAEPEGEEP